MRDTIFISHATPEDNAFTVWLASRLELLGYKVWIDRTALLGGEIFWTDIKDAIKLKAVKVLLVYSHNICDATFSGQLKPGIQKEMDFVTDAVKENPDLKDFLILLHIDQSPFNLFARSEELNHIPFNNNWAEGMEQLLKKLQKDSVPKSNNTVHSSFSKWYLSQYLIENPIKKKKELYYSNWWSIEHLPNQFYIFRFVNKEQAKAVHTANKDIISVVNANCITSFEQKLSFDIIFDNETITLNPTETYEIKVSDLLLGYERATFPTNRDAENYFKKLLKRVLHVAFRRKGLQWYELANKNLAYYHTIESLPHSKVTFSYPYRPITARPKKKQLYGKYLTVGQWHFALSAKPILAPYLGFNLKSHIVFTSDGLKLLENKDIMHRHRRKKGRRMFNTEWRDLLLGFIHSMKDFNGQIVVNVSNADTLVLKNSVEHFMSDFGYYDPKDSARQQLFTYEEEDLDELPDIISFTNDN